MPITEPMIKAITTSSATVDHAKNGFDPHAILTDWDRGTVTTDSDGRVVREWTITAIDHEFEVAPGVHLCRLVL